MSKIPVLTKVMKEKQPIKDAKAFRVWIHNNDGDDFFYESKTYSEALNTKEFALEKHGFEAVEDIIGVYYKDKEWYEAKLESE